MWLTGCRHVSPTSSGTPGCMAPTSTATACSSASCRTPSPSLCRHRCHICAGSGLVPMPRLRWVRAHRCLILSGTASAVRTQRRTPPASASSGPHSAAAASGGIGLRH
jgi:hypothetical protein